MRISKVRAKRLQSGDQVVVTVHRVLGMQGRKPKDAAPLMKLEFDDGRTEIIREDAFLRVLRAD